MKLALLKELQRDIAAKTPSAMVTDLAGTRQALVTAADVRGDAFLSDAQLAEVRKRIAANRSGMLESTEIFVRVYGPAPRMVIVGAVHIAQPLAQMAKLAGFDVTVIDCPAVASGGYSNLLPEAADGVILMLAAEATRTAVVTHAKTQIELTGANLLGAVLNRRSNYIPEFLYRML